MFNRREIMKAAWENYRMFNGKNPFGYYLAAAWKNYKYRMNALVFIVEYKEPGSDWKRDFVYGDISRAYDQMRSDSRYYFDRDYRVREAVSYEVYAA